MLRGLVAETSRIAIVDLEAGLEHLSRATGRYVDTLLVVGEPYYKSLEAAQRSFALARDLGIEAIHMVANKLRSPRDEETVREFAARHGLDIIALIPYDTAVIEADERGVALIEHGADAPSVGAIRELADRLLAA